jgi:SAM-dependent methyltransferase
MAEPRPYYSDKGLSAAFYDLTTALDPTLAGDIDLYAELLAPQSSVLELGAGTGRVALALAERGHRVLGLDLAPAMLVQAAAKLKRADPAVAERVRFVRGDMTALRLGESFDAVLCPFFALAHLPAGAAWRNVFAGVARHLKPGGIAAFHLPLAERMAEAPPPGDQAVMNAPVGAGRRLQIFVVERRFREGLNRFDQVLDYVILGPDGRVERRSRERMTYYAADPGPVAEAAGLARDGEPRPLGGAGEIHVFRKPA